MRRKPVQHLNGTPDPDHRIPEQRTPLVSRGILFVSCADCPINPGELFPKNEVMILTNLANVVPPYQSSSNAEVAAAIEYGVCVQDVDRIIVCGHTECQILDKLLSEGDTDALENSWLSHVRPAVRRLTAAQLSNSQALSFLAQSNVVLQMEHLITYPVVTQNLANNRLLIQGWLYDDAAGTVMHYDPAKQTFR